MRFGAPSDPPLSGQLVCLTYASMQSMKTGYPTPVECPAKLALATQPFAHTTCFSAQHEVEVEVQRIAAGDHPPQLSAERLMRMGPLPIDWAAQRVALGFAA